MRALFTGLFCLLAVWYAPHAAQAQAIVLPCVPSGTSCIPVSAANPLPTTGGGGSGSVTSVAAGCGSAAAPSPITETGTISASESVNAQTGTTYAISNADCGKLVTFNNASSIAVSIAQAGAAGAFPVGWYADFHNIGAGLVTITPTTSTINGSATTTIPQGAGLRIVSDGTNYQISQLASSGGSGTVTSVSVTTANGVSGTVATATTTPAISLTLGAITPTSAAIGGGSAITSSGAGGALGTNAFTSTAYAPLASPTFTGTVAFPDTSTSASAGFSFNGTAALSSAIVNSPSAPITGGSATTTFPLWMWQTTGASAVTSWSTAGTFLGVNAASGFAGNFIDFHLNGASSAFFVTSAGALTATGAGNFAGTLNASSGLLQIQSSGQITALYGGGQAGGAGILRFGNDAAAPVAQTTKVASVSAGTTDTAGATWAIQGSLSTGAGVGGAVQMKVAKTGTTGTTVNSAFPMLSLNAGNATGATVQLGDGTNFTTYDSCTALTTGATGIVACTASAAMYKDIFAAQRLNLTGLDSLRTDNPWEYKNEYKNQFGDKVHIGLIADDVEKMDPRCAVYDKGVLKNYEDRCVIAYLVAAQKEIRQEIAELKRGRQ